MAHYDCVNDIVTLISDLCVASFPLFSYT